MSILETILNRKILLVGTTGDYNPMSFYNTETKSFYGFDISFAKKIAAELGVRVEFVKTTWPTLLEQTISGDFDIALSGISITEERLQAAAMTEGYFSTGKTVLCRKTDVQKFRYLEDINCPAVKIAVNPGGTNFQFVNQYCSKAEYILHSPNQEIPSLIADKKADLMITDTVEAAFYEKTNPLLAAPLINQPFTKNNFGILLKKENKDFCSFLNQFIRCSQKNGSFEKLKKEFLQVNRGLSPI